jgi:hypothetical protein
VNDTTRCLDCGGIQTGLVRGHWASCSIRFPPLPPEAEIRAELVGKIHRIGNEIDGRYANDRGTAERALYWAYWPPSESTEISVLCHLLDDAREFLAAAPAAPVRRHSPTSRRTTKRTLPGRAPSLPARRGNSTVERVKCD